MLEIHTTNIVEFIIVLEIQSQQKQSGVHHSAIDSNAQHFTSIVWVLTISLRHVVNYNYHQLLSSTSNAFDRQFSQTHWAKCTCSQTNLKDVRPWKTKVLDTLKFVWNEYSPMQTLYPHMDIAFGDQQDKKPNKCNLLIHNLHICKSNYKTTN